MDLSPFTLPPLHSSLFLLHFPPFISHPNLPVATFSVSSKFCLLFSSILSLLIHHRQLTFPPAPYFCSGLFCARFFFVLSPFPLVWIESNQVCQRMTFILYLPLRFSGRMGVDQTKTWASRGDDLLNKE